MTAHYGKFRFICNCPSYMNNPMPEPGMTLNYFGLKKRKFKGLCHLLCQPVSKSQTLVFTTCKMPAMQIHYRPRHVFLNSRQAPFLARLDSVDDTDFFWRTMLNTLMIRFIHWFHWLFPKTDVSCPCSSHWSLFGCFIRLRTCLRICNMLTYHWLVP